MDIFKTMPENYFVNTEGELTDEMRYTSIKLKGGKPQQQSEPKHE
jgi:hypothetical protein